MPAGAEIGYCTNSPNRCFTAAAKRPVPRPTPDAKCPECGSALAAQPSGRSVVIGGALVAGLAVLAVLGMVALLTLWQQNTEETQEAAAPPAAPTAAPATSPHAPAPPARTPAAATPPPPAPPSPGTSFPAPSAYLRLTGDPAIARRLAPALVRVWLNAEGATEIMELRQAGQNLQQETGDTLMGAHLHGQRITVSISSLMSQAAIAETLAGMADVALVAAPATGSAPPGKRHLVGFDALAVVVPPASPIHHLTVDQLRRIFGGEARSQAPFGGPPGGFSLYTLEPLDRQFRDFVMGDSGFTATHVYDTVGALEHDLMGDRNAIGFVDLHDVGPARAIAVGDPGGKPVEANPDTVRSGTYPLAQPLYLYTGIASERPQASQFIAIAVSGAGQQALGEAGFVPAAP